MTIEGAWTDETHRYYCIRPLGEWDWPAYRRVVDTAIDTIKATNKPVALICDLTQNFEFHRGDVLGNLRYFNARVPTNMYACVMVGAGAIMMTFLNIHMKLRPSAKRRVRFASSMPEAFTVADQRLEELRLNAEELKSV